MIKERSIFAVDPDPAAGFTGVPVPAELTGENSHRHMVFNPVADERTEAVPVPAFCQLNDPIHQTMRPERIYQLFIRILDPFGNIHRFIMIIFQNIVNGILGNDPFIRKDPCIPGAYYRGSHPEDRFLEFFLIICFSVSYLFIEPAQTGTSFRIGSCKNSFSVVGNCTISFSIVGKL